MEIVEKIFHEMLDFLIFFLICDQIKCKNTALSFGMDI